MNIKTITRTAAIMYADTMLNRTTNTIKRKFVESIYANGNNSLLTLSELVNRINDEIGLFFSEDEIKPIVKDPAFFVEVLYTSSENIKYRLQDKRYKTLCTKPINEFEKIIDIFFSQNRLSLSLTIDSLKDLIYRYLHSILNTNIAAYSHFVRSSKKTIIPKLNSEEFSDDEIDIINKFIKWENEEKDKALFKIVNYCIEYAVVVNDSSEDVLSKALKTKIFFLDNSLIYRALGINGETRKKRTLSFLNKCKESGQKFVISKYTREEFFNTVNFHLKQLNSSTPFGQINPQIFKRYANGDGFYQFYHEWRNGRVNYGFDLFKTYIHNLYKELVNKFDILEDFNVPFSEQEEPAIIEIYKNEIQAIKRTKKNEPHLMDARNMYWIECARKNNNIDISSTKYYFVTSDQKLQYWDSQHSVNQPLTLLPSQWMGLLLKYVSRSSDDYKSFISFMNLPKEDSTLSEDELQSIMAGISEMTEEFSKQESIIESMIEVKFGDILQGNIQENAKIYAKNKLEEDFAKQIVEKEKETIKRLEEKDLETSKLSQFFEERIAEIEKNAQKQFEESERNRKRDKLQSIIKEIGSLENRKKNAEQHAWDRLVIKKWIIASFIIIPIAIWIYFVWNNNWDIMEKKTYFPPIIYFAFSILYTMIYGKSFNPLKYIERVWEKCLQEEYIAFEYSQSEYDELLNMRDSLKSELKANN